MTRKADQKVKSFNSTVSLSNYSSRKKKKIGGLNGTKLPLISDNRLIFTIWPQSL